MNRMSVLAKKRRSCTVTNSFLAKRIFLGGFGVGLIISLRYHSFCLIIRAKLFHVRVENVIDHIDKCVVITLIVKFVVL